MPRFFDRYSREPAPAHDCSNDRASRLLKEREARRADAWRAANADFRIMRHAMARRANFDTAAAYNARVLANARDPWNVLTHAQRMAYGAGVSPQIAAERHARGLPVANRREDGTPYHSAA